VTPALTQTRLNEPTTIDVSENVAAQTAKQRSHPLDIADYEKLIADDPTDAISQNNLGALYFAAGRYDEAADAIKRAAAEKPDNWNIQVNASIATAHNSDFDAALRFAQAG